MKQIQPLAEQTSLDEVRAQFEHWRQSRNKRKAIPDALWEAAASLYPAYSLHKISKGLRLNHTKLKHHVQASSPNLSIPAKAAFIDLGFGNPVSYQCNVEMHITKRNRRR